MLIIYWILALYARTWKVDIDPLLSQAVKRGSPIAFWHGLLGILALRLPPENLVAMVSSSVDGDRLSRILRYRHFALIRGSTNRGGSEAQETALKKASGGASVLYAVDGSRGPKGVPKYGAFSLACHLERPLCVVMVSCDRYWALSSWDSFVIPKPWATIRLFVHELDCSEGLEDPRSRMMAFHSSQFPLVD
jgi:lysophospholipid acyltransferase (LPLAT)-like uncharacterized protein